jgi:hypothetical protein
MSWHYLQGQEGASWEGPSLDGAPSALLRLIPIAERCSLSGSEMDACLGSRSGMTSEHLTADLGAVPLMSSLVDFRARTSVQQVSVKDLPENVRAFGTRCCELLAKFNLRLCSRRTRRISVPAGLASSSRDLPAWGMMHNGVCWELGTRVHLTDEIDSGSWLPTPTTAGNENSPSMQKWSAHRRLAQLLHTPTAKLYGNNRGGSAGRVGKIRPSLETLAGGVIISLREWLMGWPIGWTALGPLATGRFQQWLRLHGLY